MAIYRRLSEEESTLNAYTLLTISPFDHHRYILILSTVKIIHLNMEVSLLARIAFPNSFSLYTRLGVNALDSVPTHLCNPSVHVGMSLTTAVGCKGQCFVTVSFLYFFFWGRCQVGLSQRQVGGDAFWTQNDWVPAVLDMTVTLQFESRNHFFF